TRRSRRFCLIPDCIGYVRPSATRAAPSDCNTKEYPRLWSHRRMPERPRVSGKSRQNGITDFNHPFDWRFQPKANFITIMSLELGRGEPVISLLCVGIAEKRRKRKRPVALGAGPASKVFIRHPH